MKEDVFAPVYYDYATDGKLRGALADAEAMFFEAVAALEEEEQPTDLEFILKYSNDLEAFRTYVHGLRDNYIKSLGMVIKSERQRISDSYENLINTCLPSLMKIKAARKKGLRIVEDKDGGYKIDHEAQEKAIKEICTRRWKGDLLKEYYAKLCRIRQAFSDAVEFEEANKLPAFASKTDPNSGLQYIGDYGMLQQCNIMRYLFPKDGEPDPAQLKRMLWEYLSKS